MTILGGIDPARFLREHWQQQPLLVRGALPDAPALVDPDRLAGLACEDGVESRIVIHGPQGDDWHCETGPFDERRFARLPARGWTLLVQAVDLHLEPLAALRARFGFLPRWRLDDVMVSYAVDGGGVGAHFDHYDVFLVQARGTRRWELGAHCDASTPLLDHPDLKLLGHFAPDTEHLLEAGDMLYLPPGLAHRGTAVGDDCVTCSVGFRAPSHGEVIQGAAAVLAARLPEDARFRDGPAVADDPFLIDAAALHQLRQAWDALGPGAVDGALARAFGAQVTEPRHPELVGARRRPRRATVAKTLATRLRAAAGVGLAHDPSSRFAYCVAGTRAVLFVDGEAHDASVTLARGVCHGHVRSDEVCDDRDRALLAALITQGSLRLR